MEEGYGGKGFREEAYNLEDAKRKIYTVEDGHEDEGYRGEGYRGRVQRGRVQRGKSTERKSTGKKDTEMKHVGHVGSQEG